jgi:hypothetical protein
MGVLSIISAPRPTVARNLRTFLSKVSSIYWSNISTLGSAWFCFVAHTCHSTAMISAILRHTECAHKIKPTYDTARFGDPYFQVQSDLAALNLEADMIGRAVKKATSERQQKLVDLDVRKLEVQHLRESLNARADEVFTLENRKLQLEQSLKERRHEIFIHKCAAPSSGARRQSVSTRDLSAEIDEPFSPRKSSTVCADMH